MLGNRIVAGIFASVLSATAVWGAPKDTAVDPKTLISHALQLEDLHADGTPPLLLHGELQLWDAKGAVAKGEYTYNRVSSARWREHIRFVNYERIRVGDAGGYWQKSALDYEPEVIFQLEKVLKVKDALRIGTKQTLGKVKIREENGRRQQCTEVRWSSATDRILCFDESSGTLASVEYERVEGQHEPEITRLEYAGFAPVGEKLVPREVRALHGTKMVASIKVLELAETPQTDPALFNPPEGAVHWAWCTGAEDRELVTSSAPPYPAEAKEKLEQGRVIYYAVIEGDGTLSHRTLIQGAAPLLNAVTLQTLSQWRYKPAACGQTPVRTETSIAMDFWLGG